MLRDGQIVADAKLTDLPRDALVRAMVGNQPVSSGNLRADLSTVDATAASVLEIDHLVQDGAIGDVSSRVRRGECVGLADLASPGKEELGEIIAGWQKATSGSVRIGGIPPPFGKPRGAQDLGVGYIPRDRHKRGILPLLSLQKNLTIPISDTRVARFIQTEDTAF